MNQSAARTSNTLESFRRIRGDRLVARFYEHFLGSDPRLPGLFANTEFERQKQMLQHGILMMLNLARGDAVSSMALKRLGQRHHVELGIPLELYKPFIDCLLRAAAELDPQWNPRLDRAWRNYLAAGIAAMSNYADK
jgi:hemoglobin-like flavoprotein